MSNKHRRQSVTNLTQCSLPPALRDDLPRGVVSNFDRWIEAQHGGYKDKARALSQALQRAGFEPRTTPGVDGSPVYWLRRL